MLSLVFCIQLVNADGKENGSDGNVDIPGWQDTRITPVSTPNIIDENIQNPDIKKDNGVLTVMLNSDEATKFGIKLDEVCKGISNIVIETNAGFTGVLKISAQKEDTEEIASTIGVCKFEMEGFDNTFIEKVRWSLSMTREELESKGIPVDNLALYIKEGDKWDKIDTKKTDDSNSKEVFYEAESPDLNQGLFAVAKANTNFLQGIFTPQNLAYLGLAIVGMLILVAIGYLLLRKDEQV